MATIWQNLSSKYPLVKESDVQVMARWTSRSAEGCMKSLVDQYEAYETKLSVAEEELQTIRAKALNWDAHVIEEQEHTARTRLAVGP